MDPYACPGVSSRVGPGIQTQNVGPESGANWYNLYYDTLIHTGIGMGAGVQTMRNPAWDLLVHFGPRDGRKHEVVNRYTENPWRCSPVQVRQSWTGMTRPGQELTFTTVLLPHRPTFTPKEFAGDVRVVCGTPTR